MADFIIEISDKMYINHAGLSYIAKFLNDKKVFCKINRICKFKKNFGFLCDYDVVKTMLALIALGKTSFDDVEQYRKDNYFKKALNLKTVPSAPTLRQRVETYDKQMWGVLREINIDIIKNFFADESIEINGSQYIVLESDVTPFDNSDSKKEGVAKTYKNFSGYAPMMSYAGRSGFMINNELRNGDAHSNCPGTEEYFAETIGLARQLNESPLLAIMDSGNDDGKLVLKLKGEGAEFIIKRNLRRESQDTYIEYAKANADDKEINYEGCTRYYSCWSRAVKNQEIPLAVVVTETTIDKKGQPLLFPKYDIEVYWNSLNFKAKEVEGLYHKHGTSEQYHSEFKSDLDMERLPSGKFSSNYTVMLFGMISFNLLRIVGKSLLATKAVPGRRGARLRIRTVLQNIMYMAGQCVLHARKKILRIAKGYAWTPAYAMLNYGISHPLWERTKND